MTEAANFQMPRSLRVLYSILLMHCSVAEPLQLFQKFLQPMSEDIIYRMKKSDSDSPIGKKMAFFFKIIQFT